MKAAQISDDKIVISGECPSGHMPYVTADEPCPYDGSGIFPDDMDWCPNRLLWR